MRDTTFQIVSQNPDGTITVKPTSETSMVPAQGENLPSIGGGGGYRALVGGRVVTFASERDYQEASMAWREEMGRRNNGGNSGSGGGAGFLRTGSDAAEAVSSFFAGRNLRQKRLDLQDSFAAEQAARDKLGQLSGKYGDIVAALLDWIAAEQQVTSTSIAILDDQIFAMDMQAGIGVVRTMSDLWDGYAPRGNFGGGGSGIGGALAVGALGLGVGFLLSNSGGRGRRR